MSASPATPEDWAAKAEMDFKAALDLASRKKEPLPDKVVYDCAQCAEKYLKAFLVKHKETFRYRHDLRELNTKCVAVDATFASLDNDLRTLNRWSSEVRYPGVSAASDDVKDAIAAVKRVRKFARAKLGIN
jgi:HEPN domain-containing protein